MKHSIKTFSNYLKMKTSFYLVIFFLFLCQACKNTEPPTLSISINNNFVDLGDKIEVSIKSTSQSKLSKLIIQLTTDNEVITILDSAINTNLLDIKYNYILPYELLDVCDNHIIYLTVQIVQKDDLTKNDKIDLIVENDNDYASYSEFDLFAVNNENNKKGYASIILREEYSPDVAINYSKDIDFCFYFDENDSIVLASPDCNYLINNDIFGTMNWQNIKTTTFCKVTMSEFDFFNIFPSSDVYYYYNGGSMTDSITKIKTYDAYFFENNEYTGIIYIYRAESKNDKYLHIAVKYFINCD